MDLHLENYMTSLDFNPTGETVATIDLCGVCLLSDVATDSYRFHLNMEMHISGEGKQKI